MGWRRYVHFFLCSDVVSMIYPVCGRVGCVRGYVRSVLSRSCPRGGLRILFMSNVDFSKAHSVVVGCDTRCPFVGLISGLRQVIPITVGVKVEGSVKDIVVHLSTRTLCPSGCVSMLMGRLSELGTSGIKITYQASIVGGASGALTVGRILDGEFKINGSVFHLKISRILRISAMPFNY